MKPFMKKLSEDDKIKRFLSLLTQAAHECNLYVSTTYDGDVCLMDGYYGWICKVEWDKVRQEYKSSKL